MVRGALEKEIKGMLKTEEYEKTNFYLRSVPLYPQIYFSESLPGAHNLKNLVKSRL